MTRYFYRCFLSAAVLLAVGCSDGFPTQAGCVPDLHRLDASLQGVEAASAGEGFVTLDALWAVLARDEIPGWAGTYLHGGRPVILLADPAGAAAARAYVAELWSLDDLGEHIEIRRVRYDFFALYLFKATVFELVQTPELLGTWTMLDIDEVNNRIMVGVRDRATVPWFEAAISERCVPRNAFHVVEEAPSVPR
jgi:hypothetical protein